MLRSKLLVLGVACVLLVISPACGGDTPESDPRRSAKIEIFLFTDYFCPPCYAIEPYLEKSLADLDRLGVKISLVDLPISALSPIFSKYYIYAAAAVGNFTETLHVRRLFFDIAKSRSVNSEEDLIRKLREHKIRLALTDVGPVFEDWKHLIDRFGVRSTPTCIISRPGEDIKTHIGSRDIPQAINRLIEELSGTSP